MIESVPKSVPIEFKDHGNELLKFFELCRKRGIGTDVEISIGSNILLAHSFVLASYSDVFHELYFPDFYCKGYARDDRKENHLLKFTENDSISLLQIVNWMYTGSLYLHNQTLYPIMKLSKKLQIQSLVKTCKKIDDENIMLADLPQLKTFSTVQTQYDIISEHESEKEDDGIEESHDIDVVDNVTVQNKTSEPRNEDSLADQVTSSTPHCNIVSSSTKSAKNLQIQVRAPESYDHSATNILTNALTSQEHAVDMFLNEDPMIACVPDSDKREDRLISLTNGFKCLVCRRIFPTQIEGLKHVKSSHSKTYHCSQCGRIFNNKANMKRHELIKHSVENDKKFQCGFCNKRYAIKQSLRYHLGKTKHGQMADIENDADGIKKIDEECISNNHDEHADHKQPTNSLTGLEEALEELRRYEDDESIEYRTCHSIQSQPEPVQQTEQSTLHAVDPLTAYLNPTPAPIQPTSSAVQTSMQGHSNTMYTITPSSDETSRDDGPMLTTLIPAMGSLHSRVIALNQESYNSTSLATSHSLAEGSLQCDFCKLYFPSNSELTKHRKRCNRHRCHHCQRAFSQMGNLRRHIQILHSGAKPYKCKMCSKAYGIRQSLRYHMQNTHGIREQISIDARDQQKNHMLAVSYS